MSIPVNISGSRAAGILGLSKYQTQTNIWLQICEALNPGFCEKNNFELPVFEGNAATRWGTAFESALIELTEEKINKKIIDREKLFQKDYLSCHPDGIIDNEILYEGKTTSIFNFRDSYGEPGTDRIPQEYQVQVQHNMILTGLDRCILSVLVFPKRQDEFEEMGWISEKANTGKDEFRLCQIGRNGFISPIQWARTLDQMGYFHQYEIPANPELQELMIEHYTNFWNDHVLTGTPPPPCSYDDIRALIREPVGTIIATEEIERLQSEYKQIKSEISLTGPLNKRAEQIKVKLIDYMNTSGAVIDDDSEKKYILRDRAGKKIGGYSKNKNGVLNFR